MHRKLGALLASLALGLAGALALAGPAAATDPAPLTAGHHKGCGLVNITFTNNTTHTYSADVRVDGETGTDDEVTGMTIEGGPHAGKPFGQRYQKVTLAPGETARSVEFGEDSGKHNVWYRVWRGPENDYYLDWVKVGNVRSDCKPEPSEPPSASPSESPTDDPSADPSESPSVEPSASESASTAPVGVEPPRDLPVTGSSLSRLLIGGGGLLAAGAGLLGSLWFARRRGWLFG